VLIILGDYIKEIRRAEKTEKRNQMEREDEKAPESFDKPHA